MSFTSDPSRRPLLAFGDDGSGPADMAWAWITNQQWPGWHVDVLTARAEGAVEWGAPPRYTEWVPPWGRDEEVPGAATIRFLEVATDPRAMLAEGEGIDLMVLGLRTHTFLHGFVTGSTTEWLLHHPPAPLLVASRPDPLESVTICVDGSEHARVAWEAFCSIPAAEGSRVTVLTVDDGRTDATAAAADAAASLEGEVAEVTTKIAHGHPTTRILEYLGEQRSDLVVLGTRGLTGWKRLRLGSTASAVVRGAPCSALIASDD